MPGEIIRVSDNGRGIPVGIQPKLGIPAVTVVFTVLHAGGKFGGGGYKVAGGLHGVGASVVNALSEWTEVEVFDGEYTYRQRFERGNQVTELARLEQGVAAVSQSDWLEPVLCKVDKYSDNNWKSYGRKTVKDEKNIVDSDAVAQSLLDCIMTKEIYRKGDRVDIAKLKEAVLKSGLETSVKCDLIDYIKTDRETAVDSLRKLVYDFLKAEEAVNVSVQCDDITKWVHSVADNLSMTISYYSKKQIDLVMALIVYEQSLRDSSYDDLCNRFTELLKTTGGVY